MVLDPGTTQAPVAGGMTGVRVKVEVKVAVGWTVPVKVMEGVKVKVSVGIKNPGVLVEVGV